MSESNIDILKQLEQELVDINLPEMPPDPLQEILLSSIDPLDGALKLQQYVDTLTDEETEHVVRNATNALRFKHTNEYTDPSKQLEVLVTSFTIFPEQNHERRIRKDNMTRTSLKGYNFIQGTFNNIASLRIVNDEEKRVRYVPVIVMHCPILLDDSGKPSSEISLPDYAMFAISSVYNSTYSFTDRELDS